jgi:hypothetical protein
MLLLNRVKVEIFLVVVVVVGARVDKGPKSLWILGQRVVHGFHKWTRSGTGTRKTGSGGGVATTFFPTTHRGTSKAASETRVECADSVQNRINRGDGMARVLYMLKKT